MSGLFIQLLVFSFLRFVLSCHSSVFVCPLISLVICILFVHLSFSSFLIFHFCLYVYVYAYF